MRSRTELVILEEVRLDRHVLEVCALVFRHDGNLRLTQSMLVQQRLGVHTFFAVFLIFFWGLLWLMFVSAPVRPRATRLDHVLIIVLHLALLLGPYILQHSCKHCERRRTTSWLD